MDGNKADEKKACKQFLCAVPRTCNFIKRDNENAPTKGEELDRPHRDEKWRYIQSAGLASFQDRNLDYHTHSTGLAGSPAA